MYPFGLVAGVYPAAVADERLVYLVSVALVCATSWLAAACWAAVGGPDGTGAITMPLDMVVAPLTLEQTVEVVCAPVDVDDADDDEPDPEFELEPPMAMPAIEPAVPLEPEPEPEPESEPVPAREPRSSRPPSRSMSGATTHQRRWWRKARGRRRRRSWPAPPTTTWPRAQVLTSALASTT